MQNNFRNFIKAKELCSVNDKILLAVSGGIDSVVMLNLFIKAGYSVSVAHCNFNLRAQNSIDDAAFVKSLCRKHKLPYYYKSFQTRSYAKDKGVSLQMAARNLRFEWFDALVEKDSFQHVALAHNKNDIAETMLINLCRGTGLKGLHGILPKNGHYIHPLLFAERKAIESYARKQGLKWREDASNFETDYHRNKLRLKVFPILKELNPSVIEAFYKTAENIAQIEQVCHEKIDEVAKKVIVKKQDKTYLNKASLISQKHIAPYLYALISDFGFNSAQVNDIIKVLNRQPGQIFHSATHRLLNDRTYLIIEKRPARKKTQEVFIEKNTKTLNSENFTIQFAVFPYNKHINFKTAHKHTAFFDLDKIQYPLKIRPWQKADSFYPFGMKNRKKISDFLIDEKVNLFEKEKVSVLTDSANILWVIGYRNDDRYKVTAETKKVLKIEIL